MKTRKNWRAFALSIVAQIGVVCIGLIVAICIPSEAYAVTGATSVPTPHWVVGVQGLSACSGTLYTGNWILTAAHCIPNLDVNGDGRIEGMEDPGSITICCGPDANGNSVDARPADLIVRHPESTFGSNTGSDTALVHVAEPFNIGWLIEHQGAGPYYDGNGILKLHTGSSSELDDAPLSAYGYATVWLGKATARVSETFTGWYRTMPVDGAGGICGGDSGGPDFWMTRVPVLRISKPWWRWSVEWRLSIYQTGIHSNGGCGSGADSTIHTAYVAPWVRRVTQ